MSFVQADIQSPGWRKARRSMANGNCVEVGPSNGVVAVRDSKNPGGYVLAYSPESWRVFTREARKGNFGPVEQ
jgi:Domain of unknown function (DUF397)